MNPSADLVLLAAACSTEKQRYLSHVCVCECVCVCGGVRKYGTVHTVYTVPNLH